MQHATFIQQLGLDDNTASLIRLLTHCHLPDGTTVLDADLRIRPEAALACWIFNGEPELYGRFEHEGRTRRAHRVACELLLGDVGDDPLLHDCDTPGCCNVLHISPGSHSENMADRNARGRARGRNSSVLTEPAKPWTEEDFWSFLGIEA